MVSTISVWSSKHAMRRYAALSVMAAAPLLLSACHKRKDECTKLFEVAGEQRKKYKKELDAADDSSADKSAVRARVVKAVKTAMEEIGDVKVTAPGPKKKRDVYVENLDTLRTALDESVSPDKREKAMKELERINLDADYFAIGASCEDMSILDEF